jgi:hypothetical protein
MTGAVETLTWAEITYGAMIGAFRNVNALKRADRPRYGAAERGGDKDLNGALGELALAKHLDVYWLPTMRPQAGDVGRHEARATTWPNGCLIVHPEDRDDRPYYLVVNAPPTFRIVGWLLGADAKRNEWWDATKPTPAYFVPQSELLPCSCPRCRLAATG